MIQRFATQLYIWTSVHSNVRYYTQIWIFKGPEGVWEDILWPIFSCIFITHPRSTMNVNIDALAYFHRLEPWVQKRRILRSKYLNFTFLRQKKLRKSKKWTWGLETSKEYQHILKQLKHVALKTFQAFCLLFSWQFRFLIFRKVTSYLCQK